MQPVFGARSAAWYSGYWVPSKWVDASFTNTYGLGTPLYCTM